MIFHRYHYLISKKRPISRCEQVQKVKDFVIILLEGPFLVYHTNLRVFHSIQIFRNREFSRVLIVESILYVIEISN